MATVRFLGNVPLAGENLGLAARDLLTIRRDFGAQVVISAVLLIEQEAGVIDFFLESGQWHYIGVVPRLEVIVLQQFFVLQMPIFCLDSVKLITQGEVVLVTLLNFENLGFQLWDEQVLLVRRQMHAIVILERTESQISKKL